MHSFTQSEQFVPFDYGKLNEVYTTLTILDDNNDVLSEPLYFNNYKQIPLSALNEYTYMSFVAVEDKRFFKHGGIDSKRVVGAMLHNLKSKSYKEGASTISQQLIKNTHLDNSKTLHRKINEMILARELEKHYSKKEILEMYVNTIYFGRNAYGIETAANVYFDKSAAELTVSESAILAGMIKAPNVYAPDKNTQKCQARRDTVLRLMLEQQVITPEQYNEAITEQINYVPQSTRSERNYVYHVMQEACRLLNMTPLQLVKSDFIIETYCNRELQKSVCKLISEDDVRTASGSTADISVTVLNKQGGVVACLERGETAGHKRQVGSTLKPIAVYAPALNEKIITQASPVLDEETNFNGYKPTNAGGYNGWTTIKNAVAKSLNVPAVKTLNALTLPISEAYLKKMGIEGEQNLSLALGNANGGMNQFDLAKCYTTLANDGVCSDVGFIKSIYSTKGQIYNREQSCSRVFRAEANYLMTDLLVNTVENGTARLLKSSKYQIAAKTGTVGNANGNTDALVAGYTTQNTFVVWYSGNLPNEVNGATAPCTLAGKLLSGMYANAAPPNFTPPQNVVRLDIDAENLYDNQLVVRCDNGEKFWFDKLNQPTQYERRQEFHYAVDVATDHNTAKISLPYVNGEWRLYRKSGNKSELVPLQNGKANFELTCDEVFFAELYVKNRLVYTTPSVTVCFCQEQADNTEFPGRGFPDLRDFWYWG